MDRGNFLTRERWRDKEMKRNAARGWVSAKLRCEGWRLQGTLRLHRLQGWEAEASGQ